MPHRSRRTVLYVEDQRVNALLMAAIFERRPELQLVIATTGAQALHLAASVRPALLLLDLHLPDCHGSQLLTQLRARHGCEATPAVAVTSDDHFPIAGTTFTELWAKPLHLAHVLARLTALTALPSTRSPAGGMAHLPRPAVVGFGNPAVAL